MDTIYKLALTRKHIILMMITIKSKKDSGATSKEIIQLDRHPYKDR